MIIKEWSWPSFKIFGLLFFSFHPSLPLLATTSGQRQFEEPGNESDDENTMDQDIMAQVDNSLRIWAAGTNVK